MIRPLALFGMIVIAIAVFSFLLIPGWRGSPLGIGILILCLGIGGFAVYKDMRDFMHEVNAHQKPEEDESDKDKSSD